MSWFGRYFGLDYFANYFFRSAETDRNATAVTLVREGSTVLVRDAATLVLASVSTILVRDAYVAELLRSPSIDVVQADNFVTTLSRKSQADLLVFDAYPLELRRQGTAVVHRESSVFVLTRESESLTVKV